MDLYIGLDLGGTNLKYAVGDEHGNIKIKKIKSSLAQESQDKIFKNIFDAVKELMEDVNTKIKAIGVGTPGSVDFPKGQLIGSTPNIQHWTNAPIKKRIEEKFHIPVWVDNDANLVALAEARVGAGKKYANIISITLGTGIGGGIIIDNQLYRGAFYSAAEVGHIIIEVNGKPCNCGNLGCLEIYTSAPAMISRYRHKLKRTGLLFNEKEITTEFIFKKAAFNEDLAIETINETCDYLGAGIASIANIISPQAVIIGGGVAEAGEVFIKRIEKMTRQNLMDALADRMKIVKAQLGNDAGTVGAILLAAENS